MNTFLQKMEEWTRSCSKEHLEITFMICARKLAEEHGKPTKELMAALERLELSLMDTDGAIH